MLRAGGSITKPPAAKRTLPKCTRQVKLRSDDNPATHSRSIELALRRYIIDQSVRAYVTCENLDLRYGAAHGIGGGNSPA